ncbi:TRAP-type C4-dicarboxylate transport system, small permease component [Pseudooceanicola antarcticus]|uniref:TRAP transporter small permease protein n=1 Tax=Pseudooceanicola antarcticus TaxID=1247613 RepID=A0A285IJX2_9RHOB|nr:TRAP transporter small permease subunit [Pseudooceanicola antarcticus]PJE28801.1 TRAP transporter small permease [Pseudooceanicola antarcticus]SNY48203.1 TRAP-type C4-dicarboxylate transport system, small permease component [Pseudooceanicola antarcticus]
MILIGCLIFAALICFLGGAVVRALAPLHAVDWAEEVSIYCIIWASVLSGSVLVAERRHIATEVVVASLPPRLQLVLGWGVTLLTIGFCAFMALYGYQAVDFALLLDERSASTLRVPQAWAVFLALPVGMVLILGRIGLILLEGHRPFGADLAPIDAAPARMTTGEEH